MNQTQVKFNKTLIIVAIFFVFIYSILAFRAGFIFNSPDESANYFFSRLVANENRLDYPLKENSDILHPRSMTVVNQKIVSQSFLGMPLIYGFLGKIFGSNLIIFFTPIIAATGVLFFYEIIKKIFNEKIAFLSGILVFIHPAFWYYSTHSMYHNVLFASLLIMGVYFFVGSANVVCEKKQHINILNYETTNPTLSLRASAKQSRGYCNNLGIASSLSLLAMTRIYLFRNPRINIILGSLFIGLALMTRYSEAPWVFLALIILYFLNKDKISRKQIAICFFIFFILSLFIFFLNNKIYGNPFSSGYNLINNLQTSSITESFKNSSRRIFVFNIFRNFWNYGIYIFWWLSIPTCFGVFLLLKKYKNLENRQKKYLAAFFISSIYLIIYYGSWSFHDNPDPTKITIGTSYARYWLPIYIFSTPFLSVFLLKIKAMGKWHWAFLSRDIIFLSALVLLISYNFLFVLKLTDESIGRNVLAEYAKIKNTVLNLTEDNSVIIAGYYDKLFFPDRLVIENIDEERDKKLKDIEKLLEKKYAIYYYSWNSDDDILYLNKILNKYNLNLVYIKTIREGERMFRVARVWGNKD